MIDCSSLHDDVRQWGEEEGRDRGMQVLRNEYRGIHERMAAGKLRYLVLDTHARTAAQQRNDVWIQCCRVYHGPAVRRKVEEHPDQANELHERQLALRKDDRSYEAVHRQLEVDIVQGDKQAPRNWDGSL